MWLQNILTISNHKFFFFFLGGFWNRCEVGGGNSWFTAVQSPKTLLWCFAVLLSGWAVVGTFLGGARLSIKGKCDLLSGARSDKECISYFWESYVSKYWQKKNVWCFNGKKVGKMGWLLKTLRVLWYFYFATHVRFLVGSLTKQVADMERVSHRILSPDLLIVGLAHV